MTQSTTLTHSSSRWTEAIIHANTHQCIARASHPQRATHAINSSFAESLQSQTCRINLTLNCCQWCAGLPHKTVPVHATRTLVHRPASHHLSCTRRPRGCRCHALIHDVAACLPHTNVASTPLSPRLFRALQAARFSRVTFSPGSPSSPTCAWPAAWAA